MELFCIQQHQLGIFSPAPLVKYHPFCIGVPGTVLYMRTLPKIGGLKYHLLSALASRGRNISLAAVFGFTGQISSQACSSNS